MMLKLLGLLLNSKIIRKLHVFVGLVRVTYQF